MKKRKEEGRRTKSEWREKKEKNKFLLISKIYRNRTVGFRQSKRQSQSTHRELRVGTKILEFRQTPRVENFLTWVISSLKVI